MAANQLTARVQLCVCVCVDIGLVSSWVVTSSRQMPLTVIWDGMEATSEQSPRERRLTL